MFNPATPEFWVALAFVCFCGLMVYYGVPALIGSALDKRSERIRSELDEARRLRAEAQELLADYQRKARAAEDEAKAIIEQAKKEAEAIAAETRATLKDQLERRTRLAEEKIARAEAQAVADVRNAAIEKATWIAEKVLGAQLAGDRQSALVDASIKDLKARLN